jgi:hypothetical protein
MRATQTFKIATLLASLAAGSVLISAPANAGCKRFGFTVNDYGKEGPIRDAKALLDKHVAQWTSQNGIKDYTVGKKKVSCELFLNFIVFDEHTCTASASVCWGSEQSSLAPGDGDEDFDKPPAPMSKSVATGTAAPTAAVAQAKAAAVEAKHDEAAADDAASSVEMLNAPAGNSTAAAAEFAPATGDDLIPPEEPATAAAAPPAATPPPAAPATQTAVSEPEQPAATVTNAPVDAANVVAERPTPPLVETGTLGLGAAEQQATEPAKTPSAASGRKEKAAAAASAAAAAAERAAAAAETAAMAAKEAAAAAVAASAASRGTFVPPLEDTARAGGSTTR